MLLNKLLKIILKREELRMKKMKASSCHWNKNKNPFMKIITSDIVFTVPIAEECIQKKEDG